MRLIERHVLIKTENKKLCDALKEMSNVFFNVFSRNKIAAVSVNNYTQALICMHSLPVDDRN